MNRFDRPSPLGLLQLSLNNLSKNPVLIYPTLTLVFIQLLVLEILYFAPRYPLSEFFGPLIRYVWSEDYMHYPMDLVLLPKMFYYAQIFISIFIGSFMIAVTARIVAVLNEHPKVHLGSVIKETSHFYVHILCASVLTFCLFQWSSDRYTALLAVALHARPDLDPSSILGRAVLWTPYAQFLIGIIVTTLSVFVVPVIVVEKKKIIPALLLNLKILFSTFPTTFLTVFIPTIFYLPVLAVRNNIESLITRTVPDIQILVIVADLFVTMAIDLVIVTAVTTYYLYIKETNEQAH